MFVLSDEHNPCSCFHSFLAVGAWNLNTNAFVLQPHEVLLLIVH